MDLATDRKRRAAMYLRVASPDQGDQEAAIARQREGCLCIAEQHGLTVVREYADVGRAALLEQQIELLRLLGDLHQWRDVAAVIVWDYARLGRSMTQLEQVIHHIHACGAEIVTITGVEAAERFVREGRGTSPSAVEEAHATIRHAFGELWRRERSEQAKQGWVRRRLAEKQDEQPAQEEA